MTKTISGPAEKIIAGPPYPLPEADTCMAPGHQPVQQKTGTFLFDPADPVYADHFPGSPVVPGSLIIHAFIRVLEKDGFTVSGVERFRFHRFSRPGRFQYRIGFQPGRATCSLYRDDVRMARGTIIL